LWLTKDVVLLFTSIDHVLAGGNSWTVKTAGATIEGQQALLDSLQTTGDPEAIAQAQQKLEAVKVARKRQGDGGEFTLRPSLLHVTFTVV
jgi:hypothetical protein